MRIDNLANLGKRVGLTASDTEAWATRPGASWPCSFLRGRRVWAEFDGHGNLVDLSIDAGRGDQNCPADELNTIMADLAGINA